MNPNQNTTARTSAHVSAIGVVVLAVFTLLSVISFSKTASKANPAAVVPVPEELRKRKDIREIENSPDELKNLRHAFFMLKKKAKTCDDSDAQTDYDCWAAYHNNFERYGCRHGSDLFWPWHRYHLAEFEKALRSSDPANPERVASVTLPYWNWSQTASGKFFPKSVEQKELIAGEYYPEDCPDATQRCINPLWVEGRRDASECQSIKTECIQETLQLPTWRAFAGGEKTGQMSDFESQAHNFMHSQYIGGPMANPTTATEDPIYWLFHAYIDNVWDQWQTIHQPDPCSPTNVPNPARPLRIGDWPPISAQFQTVLCTKTLGYQYAPFGPPTIAALQNCPPPRAGCQTQTPETRVALSASAAIGSKLDKAEFKLSGVTIPADFSYGAWILLHPSSVQYRPNDKEFVDKYIATYFVVWRHGKHTKHKMHSRAEQLSTIDVDLDVTNKLRELVQAGNGKRLAATILFSPSNKKERSSPLVVRRDFSFSQASLIIADGKSSRTIPLTLRR
jgi:tyrosinase